MKANSLKMFKLLIILAITTYSLASQEPSSFTQNAFPRFLAASTSLPCEYLVENTWFSLKKIQNTK